MSLPASIIVNVSTEVPPVLDTSTGQNTMLFLTPIEPTTPTIDLTERVRAYFDSSTVGTDLGTTSEAYKAAVGYFSQNPHPPTFYVGVRDVAELAVDALIACMAKFSFYGVVIDKTMSDADALLVDAWVATNVMLFGRASSDVKIIDAVDTTDFASTMKKDSVRGFTYAREAAKTDYPEVATISRTIAVDLRQPYSANTIGIQPLAGIDPSNFTQAQFYAATQKNANVYEIIGPNPVVYPGVMANGLFIENQYGIDFIQAYITQLAINAIERAKKVPQTDQGMNYIVGFLDTGLAQIVASGFLAAGYWDAESIPGVVNQGELLAKGYKIVAAAIKTLTPEQRAAGYGSNIAIALKGAGAIHGLNIYMPFNP